MLGRTFILDILYRLRTNFWFIPLIMVLGAIGLAVGLKELDTLLTRKHLKGLEFVYAGGIEDARTILSTIASSMVSIAGLTFSITVVTLTLASSQFGPRLLENFVKDRRNQFVLGVFVATFIYCLFVLRTLRSEETFIPYVSISAAILFAALGAAVLIYFIHHIAVSINADNVVYLVTQDLLWATERLYPERIGQGGDELDVSAASLEVPVHLEDEAKVVRANGHGYVQALDAETVMAVAEDTGGIVKLNKRPGHYVNTGATIAYIWPLAHAKEFHVERLNSAFILGAKRTPLQDYEYSMNQLVEVALRALSPGVNDAFTATSCVDSLGTALCQLADRKIPDKVRYDSNGTPRVIADSITFEGAMSCAFNQIRQNAADHPAVSIRILEALHDVAEACRRPQDLSSVRSHAQMTLRAIFPHLTEANDRKDVLERFRSVVRAIRDTREKLDGDDSPQAAEPVSSH